MVGNACGGQPGSHESKAESCTGGGAVTIASLSPHASIGQLNNREAGPSNT